MADHQALKGRPVFVVTPFPVWPIDNGGARYVDYCVRRLAGEGSDVTIFLPGNAIPSACFEIRGLRVVLYQSKNRIQHFFNLNLVARLFREARKEKPARVYLHFPFQCLMVFAVSRMFRIPVTLVMHNIEHRRFQSMGKNFLSRVIWCFEFFAVKTADQITSISSQVRESIRDCFSRDSEIARYRPDPARFFAEDCESSKALRRKLFPPEAGIVLFFGSFLYPPNRAAFRFIRDQLAKPLLEENPAIRFLLIGRGAPAACEPNMTAIDTVEDIAPYIRLVDLVIAPMTSGDGISMKVIESLACGKRVLVSDYLAPFLEEEDRAKVLVAKPEEFAGEIRRILNAVSTSDKPAVG